MEQQHNLLAFASVDAKANKHLLFIQREEHPHEVFVGTYEM